MHQVPQATSFARMWERYQLTGTAGCFVEQDVWFSCLRRSMLRQREAVEETTAG